VRVALAYEQYFSRTADAHLCVTNAMKDYLESEFQLRSNTIRVLHDRPPSFFTPDLSCQVRHDLWQRLDSELRPFLPADWWTIPPPKNDTKATHESGSTVMSTLFTKECNSVVEDRVDVNRPALVVSSTSWTPDEDFGILLDALVELKSKLVDLKRDNKEGLLFPNLLVVVTGKGPQKQYYQEKMATMREELLEAANIAICTLWLEPEDYPRLVACADLGISLHTSTSGLDLPMKVLDLFGCHVPVCAVQFPCLDELVQHDVNGTTFLTAHQLSHQLYTLLQPLSTNTTMADTDEPPIITTLQRYSNAIRGMPRWREHWHEHAWPFLLELMNDTQCIPTTAEPSQQPVADKIKTG
jgi:beta-1,4-mannosyltransferase